MRLFGRDPFERLMLFRIDSRILWMNDLPAENPLGRDTPAPFEGELVTEVPRLGLELEPGLLDRLAPRGLLEGFAVLYSTCYRLPEGPAIGLRLEEEHPVLAVVNPDL